MRSRSARGSVRVARDSRVVEPAPRSSGRGQQASGGRTRNRLRGALVVAEISLTLVLLVGSGLMVRSFLKMQSSRNGVRTEGVVTAQMTLPVAVYPLKEQRRAFYDDLMPRLAALPGVQSASATNVRAAATRGRARSLSEGKLQDRRIGPSQLRRHAARLLPLCSSA